MLNMTITFSLIDRPSPCFLHHYCLQILYTTNFLIENVFNYLLTILNYLFVKISLVVMKKKKGGAGQGQYALQPRGFAT